VEVPNDPPLRPAQPEGPEEGKPDTDYQFSSSTTDPEGDQIWYKWSWGDGQESIWLGPYSSGDTCQATHQWDERGSYSVKVKAKDDSGEESTWSPALQIGIKQKTKSKEYINSFIDNLLEKFPRLEKIIQFIIEILTSIQKIM
jgi:hypothetical protein